MSNECRVLKLNLGGKLVGYLTGNQIGRNTFRHLVGFGDDKIKFISVSALASKPHTRCVSDSAIIQLRSYIFNRVILIFGQCQIRQFIDSQHRLYQIVFLHRKISRCRRNCELFPQSLNSKSVECLFK